MALVITTISFEDSPPTKDVLEQKLSASTGIQVRIKVHSSEEKPAHTSPASNAEHSQTWYIHFSSPPDKFESEVWCTCCSPNFEVQGSLESLDRCPHYLQYAIIATLVDLGGVAEEIDSLPDYARGTFENWKKLNRGTRPPIWKTALTVVGILLYMLIVMVLGIVLSPVLLLLILFLWWKEKRKHI